MLQRGRHLPRHPRPDQRARSRASGDAPGGRGFRGAGLQRGRAQLPLGPRQGVQDRRPGLLLHRQRPCRLGGAARQPASIRAMPCCCRSPAGSRRAGPRWPTSSVSTTRWLEMDRRLPLDPAAIEAALRADTGRRIKAVMVVQTETATGITSDMPAIRRAIDAAGHPALLVVDAIASLAAEPFAMDEWGIDCALTASQKGLMLPPGLCFVAMNQRALAVAETLPASPALFRYRLPARHPDLPVVSRHAALAAHLGPAREPGHAARGRARRRWSTGTAGSPTRCAPASPAGPRPARCRFHAIEPASRSNAVTAIAVAAGIDPDAMRRLARDTYQTALGAGLGDLEGKAFRIGHLGDLNEPMILGTLAASSWRSGARPLPSARVASQRRSRAWRSTMPGWVSARRRAARPWA